MKTFINIFALQNDTYVVLDNDNFDYLDITTQQETILCRTLNKRLKVTFYYNYLTTLIGEKLNFIDFIALSRQKMRAP